MTAADLPVGGSTGLDHIDAGRIELAMQFIISTPLTALPNPLDESLMRMFGLTACEAAEAISEARLFDALDRARYLVDRLRGLS